MFEEGEPSYYEPGNPDSFGKPPKPPTGKDLAAFLRRYQDDPQALMRLAHGQDQGFNEAMAAISHDRFLSAFPDMAEGVEFFLKNVPAMMERYGIEQPLSQLDLPFYDEILSGLWENQEQIGIGGMGTLYISLIRPPKEQSYEYIGEMIGRGIRRHFSKDQSYQTQAFFGWIGRQVMKQVCPETDFSFDRHQQEAEKEKTEVNQLLTGILGQVEKGIEGGIENLKTAQQGYDFFKEIYWKLPHFGAAETPLIFRVSHELWLEWDIDLPMEATDMDSFGRFKESWYRAGEIGIPQVEIKYPWEEELWRKDGVVSYETLVAFWEKNPPRLTGDYFQGLKALLDKHATQKISDLPKEEVLEWYRQAETQDERERINFHLFYWQKYFKDVFGEVVFHPEQMVQVTEEQLLSMWFKKLQSSLKTALKETIEDANNFKTTYFRFIEDPAIAAGYAFGQEHIEEILASLPKVVRMPEEEVYQKFFMGKPQILGAEDDYGENTSDDMYREDPNRELFAYCVEKLTSKEDKRLIFEIYHGPNAKLYEELKSFVFSEEQWKLGVDPLFFGFHLTDQLAKAFLGEEEVEEQLRTMDPLEREKERMNELKEGRFHLPQNPQDLLTNADLQIQRLSSEKPSKETDLRIKALREVRGILEKLKSKNMFRGGQTD